MWQSMQRGTVQSDIVHCRVLGRSGRGQDRLAPGEEAVYVNDTIIRPQIQFPVRNNGWRPLRC